MWKYFFKNLWNILKVFLVAMLIGTGCCAVIAVIGSMSLIAQGIMVVGLLISMVILGAFIDARQKWKNSIDFLYQKMNEALIDFQRIASIEQEANDSTVLAYATLSLEASNYLEGGGDFEIYKDCMRAAHEIIEKYNLTGENQ